jgi:hypothetical protein
MAAPARPREPAYSYAPAGIGAALLDGKLTAEPGARGWPGTLDALAAWRPTQGIYRFHPTLLEALWEIVGRRDR